MRLKTSIGIALALASIVPFATGAVVINHTLSEQERADRLKKNTNDQCLRVLKTSPNAEVTDGDNISVIIRKVDDPRTALTDASAYSIMCPNHSLADLCVGSKCPEAKGEVILRFTLREMK